MFLSHQPKEGGSSEKQRKVFWSRSRAPPIPHTLVLTSREESDEKLPHLIIHPNQNCVWHSHKPVLRPGRREGMV